MARITTRDGTSLFYKDWGKGRPIVFAHGWPLSADAWDPQMLFFGARGFRVIAHDRRGHGRSEQTWTGNDMDTYADDLDTLIEHLDLEDCVLVGHSTGGGEVTRYVGRHGTERVGKLVLISAVPPLMLQTDANPEGTPRATFDQLRAQIEMDRAQFFKDFAMPFFGFNRPGAKTSQGICDFFWQQCMQAGIKPEYDCVEAFSTTDFTEDLKQIDVPTLILHGDDDQIVPIKASALLAAKLVPGAVLKVFERLPHGMTMTHAAKLNEEILGFVGEERPVGDAPRRRRDMGQQRSASETLSQ